MYTVEEIEESRLVKHVFNFHLLDTTLVLSSYTRLERETKAKGWKSVGRFDRLNRRDSSISQEQVPVRISIVEQALAKARASITYKNS